MLDELRRKATAIAIRLAGQALDRLAGDAAHAGDAGSPAADDVPGLVGTAQAVRPRPGAPRVGGNGTPGPSVPCAECGVVFEARRGGGQKQRYCGAACRKKADGRRRAPRRRSNGVARKSGGVASPAPDEPGPADHQGGDARGRPGGHAPAKASVLEGDRIGELLDDIAKMPAATSAFGPPEARSDPPRVAFEHETAAPAEPRPASRGPRSLRPDTTPEPITEHARKWSTPTLEPAEWRIAGRPQQAPAAALRAEVEQHSARE